MTNTPTDLGGMGVMMAAMMLPSAVPFAFAFARGFRHDRLWPLAAVLLVAVYLLMWIAVGTGLFALSGLLPAWLAIVIGAVYMLTPLQRRGEARCAELCKRFEGAPGQALQTATARAGRYGLSCVLCTAGLMVAVLVLGASDLRFVVLGAAAAVLLKLRGWFAIA